MTLKGEDGTDPRQTPVCRNGHVLDPAKKGRCNVCRTEQRQRSIRKRNEAFAQGRCVKGHDLTLPNALYYLNNQKARRYRRCRKCEEEAFARRNAERNAFAELARPLNPEDRAAAAIDPVTFRPSELANEGLIADRIMALGLELEKAMPWERESLRGRIAGLQRMLEDCQHRRAASFAPGDDDDDD